jgi:hypothetical protein
MNKLKFKTVLFLLLAIIVIGGCENLLDINIDTDYSRVVFVVNPDEAGNYVESYKMLSTDLDSIVKEEGHNLADLESVKLKEARAEVISPGGNFDPVGSIAIIIEATGLPAVTLASKDDVPDGLTSSTLEVYTGELKDYLKAKSYKLTIKLYLDENLEEQMTIRAELKYKLTLGI